MDKIWEGTYCLPLGSEHERELKRLGFKSAARN
jgi:hypothetical protein